MKAMHQMKWIYGVTIIIFLFLGSGFAMAAQPWWNAEWDLRVPVTVDSGLYERSDYLIHQEVSIKKILTTPALWQKFDPNSLRVVECDEDGNQTEIPSVFIKNSDFESSGQGTLYWKLQGKTPTLTERDFYIYLGTITAGKKSIATYPSLTTADVQPAGNLLSNAGFEEGEGSNPTIWSPTIIGAKPDDASGGRTDKEAKEGQYSLAISQMKPKAGSYHYLYGGWHPGVKVTPGKTYLISGWVKATGTGSQCIQLFFTDAQWKNLPATPRPQIIVSADNGHDWKKISGQILAPPNAAHAGVGIYLFNAVGQAWFDEIDLQEVDATQQATVKLGALEHKNN